MKKIPTVDISSWIQHRDPHVAQEIGAAAREFGFFCIAGHGLSLELQKEIETLSQEFFSLPLEVKMKIAMVHSGRAWRGFFPVGVELTSGHADLKEGLYFGEELGDEDPRVQSGLPLHGANLFPLQLPRFREVVLQYIEAMTGLSHLLMEAVSVDLGLPIDYFRQNFTQNPTLLFRIFHYPPASRENEKKFPWGVGEHTDYGLLTVLQQDAQGGLQVQTREGWVDVPPRPDVLVCNVGDMLDYLTHGLYRSVPHRVKNVSGRSRYSFPFFFDPGFAALIAPLPTVVTKGAGHHERWDQQDLYAFQGTYGEYLLSKVSKVFPELAKKKL